MKNISRSNFLVKGLVKGLATGSVTGLRTGLGMALLTALLMSIVVGCSHWPFKSENQGLQMVVADYYAELYAFYPHLTKGLGLTQATKSLPAYSKANLANRISDLKGFKTRVEKIRGESLSQQESTDAEILSHRISGEIFELESLRVFNQDPSLYFRMAHEILEMNFESSNSGLLRSEAINVEQVTSEFLQRVQLLPLYWVEMQKNIESVSRDTIDFNILQLQRLRDLLLKKQFSYFEGLLQKNKSDQKLRTALNTQKLVTEENFRKLSIWLKSKATSKKMALRKDDLQKLFYYQEFFEGDLAEVARGVKLALDQSLQTKATVKKMEKNTAKKIVKPNGGAIEKSPEKHLERQASKKDAEMSSVPKGASEKTATEKISADKTAIKKVLADKRNEFQKIPNKTAKQSSRNKTIAKNSGRGAETAPPSQNIESDIARTFKELTKWMEEQQWVSVYSSEPPEIVRTTVAAEVMGAPMIFVRQLPLQKEKVKDQIFVANDASKLAQRLLKEFVIQNLYPGDWLLMQTPQASSSKVRLLNRPESYSGGWSLFSFSELGQNIDLWADDVMFRESVHLKLLRSRCRLYTGLQMHLGHMNTQQAREFWDKTCAVSAEQAKLEVGQLIAQPQSLAADFGFYILETWQAERQAVDQEKFQKRKFMNGILKNQGLPPALIKRES